MTPFSLASLIALYLVYFGTVHGRVGFGEGEQEWGYATVRPGAYMFWWLHFTTNTSVTSVYKKPLLIWLQGGPGVSSTGCGNFQEIGPYDVHVNPRNHTWVKEYNVLFIDSPVGTGFSYVDEYISFATTDAQVAADLLETMNQFFEKLPEFRKVPTYVIGQSYGGKIAAEFTLLWRRAEKAGTIQSNLKGVALGNPWISPLDSVLTWAPLLFQMGMLDSDTLHLVEWSANETKEAVLAGKWSRATTLWYDLQKLIVAVAGDIDFYNILTKIPGKPRKIEYGDAKTRNIAMLQRTHTEDDVTLYRLMNSKVKKALKLDVKWVGQRLSVFTMLYEDFMKPATHTVDSLLQESKDLFKVLIYTGQLDLFVDTPGTLKWVENLKWEPINTWKKSLRRALTVDGVIEGYYKKYKNIQFFWIYRSGHMVPVDNPLAAIAMLKHLTQFIV